MRGRGEVRHGEPVAREVAGVAQLTLQVVERRKDARAGLLGALGATDAVPAAAMPGKRRSGAGA